MKTIDGQTLKQMLISGGNNLYNHYPEVDALNVFPVPDGDTGMNMNLTMTSRRIVISLKTKMLTLRYGNTGLKVFQAISAITAGLNMTIKNSVGMCR